MGRDRVTVEISMPGANSADESGKIVGQIAGADRRLPIADRPGRGTQSDFRRGPDGFAGGPQGPRDGGRFGDGERFLAGGPGRGPAMADRGIGPPRGDRFDGATSQNRDGGGMPNVVARLEQIERRLDAIMRQISDERPPLGGNVNFPRKPRDGHPWAFGVGESIYRLAFFDQIETSVVACQPGTHDRRDPGDFHSLDFTGVAFSKAEFGRRNAHT